MAATSRVKVRQIKRRYELSALSLAKMQKNNNKKEGWQRDSFSQAERVKNMLLLWVKVTGQKNQPCGNGKWKKNTFSTSCLTDEPTHKGKTEQVFLFLRLFYQSLSWRQRSDRENVTQLWAEPGNLVTKFLFWHLEPERIEISHGNGQTSLLWPLSTQTRFISAAKQGAPSLHSTGMIFYWCRVAGAVLRPGVKGQGQQHYRKWEVDWSHRWEGQATSDCRRRNTRAAAAEELFRLWCWWALKQFSGFF